MIREIKFKLDFERENINLFDFFDENFISELENLFLRNCEKVKVKEINIKPIGENLKRFKLIVDNGKPSEEILTEQDLKARLKKIRQDAETGEYAFIDVDVYLMLGTDINKSNWKALTEDEINKIEGIK